MFQGTFGHILDFVPYIYIAKNAISNLNFQLDNFHWIQVLLQGVFVFTHIWVGYFLALFISRHCTNLTLTKV